MLFHRVQGEVRRVVTPVIGESRTKQSFKDVSNINAIMSKYDKTGIVEHFSRYQGSYGDFGTESDYHTCLNTVNEAHEMFMSLPASLRKRFDNDAASFLEFVGNSNNRDEAVELGLLPPVVKKDLSPSVQKDVAPSSPPKEA